MNYCSHCGSPLEETDAFCSKCGHRNSHGENRHFFTADEAQTVQKEPLDKLCCELAYSGTLFWVPLLICPEAKNVKFHANQGLWLLILSVILCTVVRGLSLVNDFFSGSILGVFSGAAYSLAFIVFLFVMLYLAWNAVKRALAIHRDENPEPILFFDRLQIIKD